MVYLINLTIMARLIQPYVEPIRELKVSAFKAAILRVPQPLDSFLHEEVSCDGEQSVILTSDITMLFNQERLDRATRQVLLDQINAATSQSDAFAKVRSKLTDDQLISFVKSRFIQSPSELLAWTDYLSQAYSEAGLQQAPSSPVLDVEPGSEQG